MIRFGFRLLSRLASFASINEVHFDDDGESVRKRRRRFAFFWIWPGNAVLRFRRAPVRVLACQHWMRREKRIASLRCAPFRQIDKREIVVARLAGVTLREFLLSSEAEELKMAAFRSAAQALFAFHSQSQESHGDASVSNVMIDRTRDECSATWFDFDLAHRASIAFSLRRADDLRALAFTACRHFDGCNIETLISVAKSVYDDTEVWQQFDQITTGRQLARDVFHRAQLLRSMQWKVE